MTAAMLDRPATGPDREVTWRQLATLVDERDLQPGYSQSTGRAFVTVDGVLVWANVGRAALPQDLPGAYRIATARLQSYIDAAAVAHREWLASLTDDERARVEAAERRIVETPDPPQHKIDAYCERHGIGELR